MAINIKELYTSDLDPNSGAWWSQDKIDKINYNFNQFVLGGMTGPMGAQGPYGNTGYRGDQGPIGNQGARGDQGLQGGRGVSEWIESGLTPEGKLEGNANALFPAKNLIQEYTPVILGIGYLDYSNQTSPITFSYYSPTLNIKTHLRNSTYRVHNLKLAGDGAYSHHGLLLENGKHIYREGRISSGGPGFSKNITLNQNSKYIIQSAINTNPIDLIIVESNILINCDLTIVNANFKSNKDLIYPKGAHKDKILVAKDNLGNVEWADKNSTLPGFSYGMIISVPGFVFNSTNFELETTYTQVNGQPIRFKHGRGKIGGQYEGWYLCNGQSWNTSPGANETAVPNLNIISIDIDENGDQQQITFNRASSIIGGGYPIKLEAVYSSSGYNVTGNINLNSNDTTTKIYVGTGTTIPQNPPTGPNISTLFFTTYTNNTPPTSYPTNFAYSTSETATCSSTSFGGFVTGSPAPGFGLWSSDGGPRASYTDLQVGDIIFTNPTSGVRFNGNNQWGRLATSADIAIESNSQNYPLIFRINTDGIITGIYNCSTSTLIAEWSEPTQQTDATHDLTKMIYLVKLNRNDLEWEQSDAVAPPTTYISLNGPYDNFNFSCLVSGGTQYSWNGSNDWETFNANTSNYYLYNLDTYTYAPTGWYQLNGVNRYWNQSAGAFQVSANCSTYTPINLGYSNNVMGVNGTSITGSGFLINNTVFESATYLWNPSTNSPAAAGWYRSTGTFVLGSYLNRRYWDGTQFKGETIIDNWVYLIESEFQNYVVKVSNSSLSSTACQTFTSLTTHTIFFSSLFEFQTALPSTVSGYADSTYKRIIFYVYENWTEASEPGKGPLVKIINQTFPGSSDPNDRVRQLVDGVVFGWSTLGINQTTGGPAPSSGLNCPIIP